MFAKALQRKIKDGNRSRSSSRSLHIACKLSNTRLDCYALISNGMNIRNLKQLTLFTARLSIIGSGLGMGESTLSLFSLPGCSFGSVLPDLCPPIHRTDFACQLSRLFVSCLIVLSNMLIR